MLKDFQVDLELSPKDNRVIQTGATYWSHDVNTAKIVVNLKRNSEPIILSSTVSVRMIMVFDDNDTQKKQVHKMTIDDTQNGVVSLVLPKETLGFVGNVLCGVYVNYGENQSTDNGYFTFSMRRSLIDGEFPQLENGYVSEFQTMLDYMIETASEFDNVEEELNKRIDVIEKDIASNEVAKQSDVDSLQQELNANVSFLKKENMRQLTRINRLEKGVDYVSPPTNGYKKGDIWYFAEGTHFPGMNLVKDSQTVTGGDNGRYLFIAEVIPKYAGLLGTSDCTLMCSAKLLTEDDERKKMAMYIREIPGGGSVQSDFSESFTTTPTDTFYKTVLKPYKKLTRPGVAAATHSAVGNNGPAHISFSKPFLCVGDYDKYSPTPDEIIKENRLLIATKDNDTLDFNDWKAYDDELYKPNFVDMQKQIDELKNAITSLGGTL